jgi:hypothetical protein
VLFSPTLRSLTCLFLLGIWLYGSQLSGQVAPLPSPSPSTTLGRTLQSADINDRLMYVLTYQKLSIPIYEVKGQTPFPDPVLYASKIVFHPGSTLVFTNSGGDRNEIYIVAQSIVVESSGQPSATGNNSAIPTITWFRDDTSNRVVPSVGLAPPGTIGGGSGAPGTPGAEGAIGNPGYPGRNAPTLYLIVGSIVGQVGIDLRGQVGGVGGVGQTGGTGGPGLFGRPAASQLVFCASGGGDGGRGGDGGKGGKGGTGGRGGSGGSLIVASSQNVLDGLLSANLSDLSTSASTLLSSASPSNTLERSRGVLWFSLLGGDGGKGGEGGTGGLGGPGGDGGPGSGPCSGGRHGPPGDVGHVGDKGDDGPAGNPGTFAVVPLPDTLINLLGINHNAKRR